MPYKTTPHGRAAQRARARLTSAVRRGDPPDAVDAYRRDLAVARLIRAVSRILATAPSLTDEQRARIVALLDGRDE